MTKAGNQLCQLELEAVTAGYDGRAVVRDVRFSASRGEMVGLIGPNGSGKSTLLRAVSGVLAPFSGRVLLNGADLSRFPRGELARLVAVVPQNPPLPESFTALELVMMGRYPHLGFLQYEGRRDLEICRWAMEATGTWHLAGRRMGQVSGGERQRVVIARALAQQSRVLLLDEPTAHLDINHQEEIMGLVRRLREGMAVVVAIHDLNLAASFCDRLVLLNGGTVFAQGFPAEVLTVANIRAVYGTEVVVQPHPVTGLPAILLLPRDGVGRGPV